jgi:cystathionine beta-lyase
VQQISWSSGYHVDVLAYEAALAAYRDGDQWLSDALAYMTENRDYFLKFMREELPMLKTTIPEATYLAWIDCSALQLPADYTSAYDYFLKKARVAVNPGTFFGKGHDNFIRMNFACPRSLLEEGLQRVKRAVDLLA